MVRRNGKILILVLVLIVAVSIAMTYWEKYGPGQKPPLKASLEVERYSTRHTFTLVITDADNRKFHTVRLPDRQSLKPPVLIVIDPDGRVVQRQPMKKRFGGRWVATVSLKGDGSYLAYPKINAPGIPIRVERQQFDR